MATTLSRKARLPSTKRYEFQDALGSGGMGTVYRALDRETGEAVAIKVLDAKLSENPTLHARLVREFKAARELEHPNIVRALAFENDGTISYVVYELVDGCSLGERVDEYGRLAEADGVRIITQVAQALHYAHEKCVVHRDVKPDNILLLPDGRVKLTDFGLAKDYSQLDDECLTRAASGLGTPHFMAPEQFADARTAGPLCDVYSLGATLYALLTGVLPFDAEVPVVILGKKETVNLTPLRKLAPDVSDHVERAIRAAVDPDPAKRPQSCLAFFRMLLTKHKPEDVLTTPLPPPQRLGKVNRRIGVRYPMKLPAVGVVDRGVHSDGENEDMWPLMVQDLSTGGAKLLLARRFEPGTELMLELAAAPKKKPRRFALKVVRVKPDLAGHWSHGCCFTEPLTPPDLKLLLKAT